MQAAGPDLVTNESPRLGPNDPYYLYQYYLKNTASLNGVPVDDSVEPAWDLTTGHDVKVAVLDNGIDGTHYDLCGGPPHNAGYDVFQGMYPGEDAWHPYTGNVADAHGTWVAGVISGCRNNSVGIAGIAPSATLLSVRIYRNDQLASCADVVAAIHWAWSTQQADVLSNSWRWPGQWCDQLTSELTSAASSGRGGLGTAVIFAAGNTSDRRNYLYGGVEYPASVLGVIAVGAIDRNGDVTNYTPESATVHLVAPSGRNLPRDTLCTTGYPWGDVVTIDPIGTFGCSFNGSNDYMGGFDGTSAAAPQVSGAAALLYSLYPTLTWGDAKNRIIWNSDYWGSAPKYGAGKLNIYHILVPAVAPLVVDSVSGPRRVRPSALCTWTAWVEGGLAPYVFSWVPPGNQNGASVTEAFTASSSLRAFVQDAQGRYAQFTVSVTVASNAPTCRQ